MSESIDIPRRKGKARLEVTTACESASPRTNQASPASSASTDSKSPANSMAERTPLQDKGKTASSISSAFPSPFYGHERRTSLLGSSLSKSEHTVINIGDDERPRLITCVKASQGYDWNQDLFLPSYLSDRYHQNDLERRQDPVEDIFISDEEAQNMFPI